jgi:hypothetical protein
LEGGVTDREHFADDEDLRFQVGGDGDGEAIISANVALISSRRIPRIAPLRKMFSRPGAGAHSAYPGFPHEAEGPTAGTETVDPLEFLARVFVHIPDQGHVTTRYFGWYANRPRACAARPRARRLRCHPR